MGETLTGKKRKNTYTWLLQLGSSGLAAAKRVLLGDGTESSLLLSSNTIGVTNAGGKTSTLSPEDLTADHTHKLPNVSGTLTIVTVADGVATFVHQGTNYYFPVSTESP